MTKNRPTRDPRAPKRNMSAYLLYQNAMRNTFKAQNPGMTFGQLAKYTSAMYAEMPPHEKESWQARAEADKARYLHELSSYVPPPGYDANGDAIVSHQKGPRKSGKPSRDAHAPKRNMSAYLLYQNAMREQFKSENPGMTFGQLAKYTSHMYKSLTSEERAAWEVRAAQDKARFDAEMSQYVPPPGHDAQGNLMDDHKYGKRVKKAKDPNAPKRARGSFVFFTFEMRPQIMREFADIKFVEMGNIMGERWRNLPPHEKKRFEDMAAADKERFNQEMQEYTATKAAMMAQHQAEMHSMRQQQEQHEQQHQLQHEQRHQLQHEQQHQLQHEQQHQLQHQFEQHEQQQQHHHQQEKHQHEQQHQLQHQFEQHEQQQQHHQQEKHQQQHEKQEEQQQQHQEHHHAKREEHEPPVPHYMPQVQAYANPAYAPAPHDAHYQYQV